MVEARDGGMGRDPSTGPAHVVRSGGVRSLRLELTSLRARLEAVAPHAHLVSEQLVRRLVRRVRGVTGVRSFVPHTHALAVKVEALGEAVEARELAELGELRARDGWVLLVTVPDGNDPRETWRRLFHARVDEELGRAVERGELGPAKVRALIDRIGQVPMDEARLVLREEGLVTAGADPTEELIELVALHEELRCFAPHLLAHTFPALVGLAAPFRELVDGDALLAETRLEGAAAMAGTREAPGAGHEPEPRGLGDAHHVWASRLRALGVELDEAWSALLSSLSHHATAGMASLEARLIHDLRRACDDGAGQLTSLDLGRALRSFLREPVRRREAVRQKVAVARHLARALRRLPATRLSEAERRRGLVLLEPLVRRFEDEVRREVGALILDALSKARLIPRDIPEEVAREKLAAELCDRLLDKGFIAFPDLRDQIARNRLKLDDLRVRDLVRDPLLKLDRALAERLGAAYRPAELYRRFFHRVSSYAFANPVGRLGVRYLALPFGGAFILVKGFDLVILSLVAMVLGLEPVPPPAGAPPGTPHEHALQVFSLPLMLAVGAVLFLLLHFEAARKAAHRALSELGRGLRFVFVTLPRRFRALPWVDRLVNTRAFAIFYDHLWRPLLYAVIPTLVAVLVAGDSRLWLWVGLPLTAAWSVFFATRVGRRFTEAARDWAVTAWRDLRHDIVPGLIAAVLAFFAAVVERLEVVLYAVDQRLRYHRGGVPLGVGLRAVLGLLWSVLAYLVRLVINLVAEPQLNPIKHFPVVTIAHKVTIPWSIAVHQSLKDAGLSEAAASLIGLGAFQLVVPGIAGFLVWELKENWRLYRATMKPELGPVIVGSHGEPVYRFLRPGFHSGTVPTLFKKLRKAERRGNAALARRHLEALHHVEVAMERFFLREVKALLVRSGQLPEASALTVEHVTLTPSRVALDLGCPPLGERPLRLAFAEQSGFLMAAVVEPGFLAALGDPSAVRRIAFATAMMGLYKLAGVDLVRGHIRAALPDGAAFDVSERGLVVWDEGFSRERVYPLTLDRPTLVPEGGGEPLRTDRIAFSRREVKWDDWRRAWEGPAATRALRDRVMGEQLLLPRC